MFRDFLPIANNQKNRNQFKLTYLRDFALFTDIILSPSANYFQLTVYSEHIDVLCITKWFGAFFLSFFFLKAG